MVTFARCVSLFPLLSLCALQKKKPQKKSKAEVIAGTAWLTEACCET